LRHTEPTIMLAESMPITLAGWPIGSLIMPLSSHLPQLIHESEHLHYRRCAL
jgi:hypothetical protein